MALVDPNSSGSWGNLIGTAQYPPLLTTQTIFTNYPPAQAESGTRFLLQVELDPHHESKTGLKVHVTRTLPVVKTALLGTYPDMKSAIAALRLISKDEHDLLELRGLDGKTETVTLALALIQLAD